MGVLGLCELGASLQGMHSIARLYASTVACRCISLASCVVVLLWSSRVFSTGQAGKPCMQWLLPAHTHMASTGCLA